MLSSYLLFVKEDSIMFNLSEEREEEASRLIAKVYSGDHKEVL